MSTFHTVKQLMHETATAWVDDYASSLGAAISFYTLFSLAPLLLIVISISGLIFGADAARGEVFSQLRQLLGEDGARAVERLLTSANANHSGSWGTIGGAVMLLIGASSVFGELQNAFDRIWSVPTSVKTSAWWNVIQTRLISFGMILALGFLLIVSLAVSAGLAAWSKWWSPIFGQWQFLSELTNFVVSFLLITSMFALIYKTMPRVKLAWNDVWVGAGVTALLFVAGKFLIAQYIARVGVASEFGAATSIVILLIWVYYSAQLFLAGAEFTWVYAHRIGSLKSLAS